MTSYCQKCGSLLKRRREGKKQWYDQHTGKLKVDGRKICPKRRHWWDGHSIHGRPWWASRGHRCGFAFPLENCNKDGWWEYKSKY